MSSTERARRNPFAVVRPCAHCPFRTDVQPYLRPERARDIAGALLAGEDFPCHATIDYSGSASSGSSGSNADESGCEPETLHDTDDSGCETEAEAEYEYATEPDTSNAARCAGAMILCEKHDAPTQAMRIGERLGLYDRRALVMTAPVFDTFEQWIAAQPH